MGVEVGGSSETGGLVGSICGICGVCGVGESKLVLCNARFCLAVFSISGSNVSGEDFPENLVCMHKSVIYLHTQKQAKTSVIPSKAM